MKYTELKSVEASKKITWKKYVTNVYLTPQTRWNIKSYDVASQMTSIFQ